MYIQKYIKKKDIEGLTSTTARVAYYPLERG
jgi:hypothetical protein